MRTEVISADTIDAAVDRILVELKYTTSSRENAIYFDGWNGLGASAVLRAVAQRLSSDDPGPGLKFEHVIHIDCSKWEGTRGVQRAIAEHLKLPGRVMEMLDEQDEEDDFNGVVQGSRAEIGEVAVEIERSIQSSRFLLVLHNGGNEEIHIVNLGLSLYGNLSNKMLWTFQGRSRLDPKLRDATHVVLRARRLGRDPQELWFYLLREETAQVARKRGIDPAIFAECFSYMLEQSYMSQHTMDYDWTRHACNYWICEGIIQQAQGIHELLQEGGALHREMELFVYLYNKLSRQAWEEDDDHELRRSHMVWSAEHRPYWISTETCGFLLRPEGIIPVNMFQHSDKLGVLKLSRCTFSFSSPPFLSCHSLRFLWLDHCQDLVTSTKAKEEEEDATKSWACFQNLWVLDLRYTDWNWILSAQMIDLMTQLMELNVTGAKNWDMSRLRGRLRNIRKLRITKSICCNYDSSFFSEMDLLELLDFSGNDTTQGSTTSLSLPDGIKTAIIHGCSGLRNISFRGCPHLKNLFLSGLRLEELDLSGTTLQTIDLSKMELPNLKQLLLLSCEGLRAILLPPEQKWPKLSEALRIDITTTSTSVDGGEENLAAIASVRSSSLLVQDGPEAPRAHPHGSRSLREQKEEKFNKWQISLTDARLLRSLHPVRRYLEYASLHIDICPGATLGGRNVVQGTRISNNNEQVQIQPHTSTMVDSKYRDVFEKVAPANSDDCDDGPTPSAVMMMWDCPEIYLPENNRTCIIKIMYGQRNRLSEGAQSTSTRGLLFPDFINYRATSLHVYDNSSITCIPSTPKESRWNYLRWCRVERCPKLHTVFTLHDSDEPIFYYLRTFWASQLRTTRYIWNWPSTATFPPHRRSFEELQFLHLDYCPRLIHVLPLSIHMTPLRLLDTIEIVCCGDLTEVFPLHLAPDRQEKTVLFPRLRGIHLHELPKLRRICGHNISAPELETVKIKVCWILRRLPALSSNTKRPKVECEKEWWDGLEWDGIEAKHDRSLYQPSHAA